MGPLAEDHSLVKRRMPCDACSVPFAQGDYVTLIPTLPADNEEWKKMEEGRPYNATAVVIHWDCRPNRSEADKQIEGFDAFIDDLAAHMRKES